jgi:hypothetical protein
MRISSTPSLDRSSGSYLLSLSATGGAGTSIQSSWASSLHDLSCGCHVYLKSGELTLVGLLPPFQSPAKLARGGQPRVKVAKWWTRRSRARCKRNTPGSARRASLRPASGPSSLALCSRAAQERPTRWWPWALARSASPARKWLRMALAGSCTTRTPRCAHGAACCSTSSTSSSLPPRGRSSLSSSPPIAVDMCCGRA